VAIFPASLYALAGPGAYFAFIGLLLAATFITDRLSLSIEAARRRTRELEHLEHLGHGIILSTPDRLDLPSLLAQHVPPMFPACRLVIRLASGDVLLDYPPGGDGPDSPMWRWQPDSTRPHVFRPGGSRPWQEDARRGGVILVPILAARGDHATGKVIGRIYLRSEEHALTVERLIPAAQSLAAQIASALFSGDAYRQSVAERAARQQADRELALGAEIQTSFLPPQVPAVEGWEIAATLEPARETSGDFFDFIPLNGGRLGIVVADVADKGLGAAFYMALTCTLLRTYAFESSLRYPRSYPYRMSEVLEMVSSRLIHDTSSDTFVTLFYGILDPRASMFYYVNAGHNPPYLFHRDRRRRVKALTRTGPVLGILDDVRWKRRSVRLEEGDVLLLYSDGLTEAEDPTRSQFGEERVLQVLRDNLHQPVGGLCDAILASVYDFAGGAARSDDITLLLLRRTTGDVKWATR
jgi:serine phosphatase RsbU (regulator of sigma subunit)